MTKGSTLTFFLFFFSFYLSAQTITGSVTYTETTISSFDAVNPILTVADASGFVPGDEVLIIQMQGADLVTTDGATYGSVSNYDGAGSYELGIICEVAGNDITLDYFVENTYSTTSTVRLIKVPVYEDVTITGTLTTDAWDGTTGGVLIVKAEDAITLLGDINMDGKGFRGGTYTNSTITCQWFNTYLEYAYTSSDVAGRKGEGIAEIDANHTHGKGAWANGGGGGNDHNSGGAGGSNTSVGGLGGFTDKLGLFDCKGANYGINGYALNTTDRLFLGGGGGAGHGNNNQGTSGTAGGGIIILIAKSLLTTSAHISADGKDALNTSYGDNDPGGDAAGGGGAGGSIYIDVTSFLGNFSINAKGGNGGSVVHSEQLPDPDCWGPGGGGSGGVIKFKNTIGAGVTTDITGGTNGINTTIGDGVSSCNGSASGATAGALGSVLASQGDILAGTTDYTGCDIPLPIELNYFSAALINKEVLLTWETQVEINNDFFTLERSKDGVQFEELTKVAGAGNSSEINNYSYRHTSPWLGTSYYRLKQTDFDGQVSYSKIAPIYLATPIDVLSVFPNPTKGNAVTVAIQSTENSEIQVALFSVLGQKMKHYDLSLSEGINNIDLPINGIASGVYLLTIRNENTHYTQKLVVEK